MKEEWVFAFPFGIGNWGDEDNSGNEQYGPHGKIEIKSLSLDFCLLLKILPKCRLISRTVTALFRQARRKMLPVWFLVRFVCWLLRYRCRFLSFFSRPLLATGISRDWKSSFANALRVCTGEQTQNFLIYRSWKGSSMYMIDIFLPLAVLWQPKSNGFRIQWEKESTW